MTPEKAMSYAREDISQLSTAPTPSSRDRLHTAIVGYCLALLECQVISKDQWEGLISEVDAELSKWQIPAALPVDWPQPNQYQ